MIITTTTTYVQGQQGGDSYPDPDATNIVAAYNTYVASSRSVFNALIGKSSLIGLTPFSAPIAAVLRARRDRPELFTRHRRLDVSGPAAEHAVAFDRGGALAVATRWPVHLAAAGGWGRPTTWSHGSSRRSGRGGWTRRPTPDCRLGWRCGRWASASLGPGSARGTWWW